LCESRIVSARAYSGFLRAGFAQGSFEHRGALCSARAARPTPVQQTYSDRTAASRPDRAAPHGRAVLGRSAIACGPRSVGRARGRGAGGCAAIAQVACGDRGAARRTPTPASAVEAIDTQASPPHFDVHFIAGPEAGNTSLGIYQLAGPDQLTLCLGLVHSPWPRAFATGPGLGCALERGGRHGESEACGPGPDCGSRNSCARFTWGRANRMRVSRRRGAPYAWRGACFRTWSGPALAPRGAP